MLILCLVISYFLLFGAVCPSNLAMILVILISVTQEDDWDKRDWI